MEFSNFASSVEEVGIFSLDEKGKIKFDESETRYLRKSIGIDLNQVKVSDAFKGYLYLEPDIEFPLEWLKKSKYLEKNPEKKPDFVIKRGLLRSMIVSNDRYNNRFEVCLVQGIRYICELRDQSKPPKKPIRRYYHGPRFEKLATFRNNQNEELAQLEEDQPYLCNRLYRCVLLRIQEFRVLVFGEIDCRDPRDDKFIEIKTACLWNNMPNYMIRCWLHSALLGVPKILFGFLIDRSSTYLTDIKLVDTSSVHELEEVRRECSPSQWKNKTDNAMEKCHILLSRIRNEVQEETKGYIYSWNTSEKSYFAAETPGNCLPRWLPFHLLPS